MYDECGDDTDKIAKVTLDIQKKALAECGVTDPRGIIALHNMRHDYQGDNEVLNLAVYHRTDTCYNARRNRIGGSVPASVKVHTLDGKPILLSEYPFSYDREQVFLGMHSEIMITIEHFFSLKRAFFAPVRFRLCVAVSSISNPFYTQMGI